MNIDFILTIDGELADPDANDVRLSNEANTFGVRRTDTLATVVPDNTAMTRLGVGTYRYVLAEPAVNLGYEYFIKFYLDGALNRFRKFIGNLAGGSGGADPTPVSGRYTSTHRLYQKFGQSNVLDWARFADDESDGDLQLRIAYTMEIAEQFLDDALRGCRYTIPFVIVPETIRDIATILAGNELYEARGIEDVEPGQQSHRLAGHHRMAMQKINDIRTGALILSVLPKFNVRVPQVVEYPPTSPTPTGNPGIFTDLEALP